MLEERETGNDIAGRKPLTVSAAMALAKGALEGLTVTLVGEVSEVSNKPGYKAVYFTVKDEGASLPCMMWQNRFASAGVALRVGQLVQLTGRFTLYAPKGRMNFDVFSLALAGEGDLRERVAALARKLQAEGLMAPERKRRVPVAPSVIGVVTSPRGAAVHDVLRTLRRRWPVARVLLAGVPVEGVGAPAALAQGLACVASAGAEVVLLVRGGGSFEDLMPFNDEALCRAVAACPVPVVTGIGHEPDTSIADMVADLRASTPTAAAEAVAPDAAQLRAGLDAYSGTLAASLQRAVDVNRLQLERVAAHPYFRDPHTLFATDALGLDALAARLSAVGPNVVAPFEAQMRLAASRLNDLSPLAVLGRGYSLVRTADGSIVKSTADAPAGSAVTIRVSDGTLAAHIDGAAQPMQPSLFD